MPRAKSFEGLSWEPAISPEPALTPVPEPNSGYGDYCARSATVDEADAIRRYMPLVKKLALHLRGRIPDAVQLDDLIQAGLIAILRIMRHDAVASPTDARLRRAVVNAMIDEVRCESWAPVRTMRLAKAATATIRSLRRRTGRDPTDEEVAAELQISAADYQRLLLETAGIRLLSLDAFEENSEAQLQVAESQEASLDRQRMMAALTEAITALPEREKLVVSLYYEHELNMEEVGKVLGIDKSTVCRAHGRALLMLRSALSEARAAAPGLQSVGE